MSTETTNKKIKIDNGTTFGRTYTDKAVDERLQGLVNTATFTPVKEKANNSLQKPAGLTKTELVGVGANGQENIEIGDNLTLANGKLSATGGGGGEGLNVLSLNLKDCMNESDYDELIGYILQQTVIAKTYDITLPDLTGVDIVKFTIEASIGNIITTFYRNSKEITQFNWLCNWTDNENFMQMVTITGFTDNDVNFIKYNGINSADTNILPLPADASTSTYVLKAVNGTVQWDKEAYPDGDKEIY
jgi:hypothetical protein